MTKYQLIEMHKFFRDNREILEPDFDMNLFGFSGGKRDLLGFLSESGLEGMMPIEDDYRTTKQGSVYISPIKYARRLLLNSTYSGLYNWLFSGAWARKDNSYECAMRRIKWAINKGVPSNHKEILYHNQPLPWIKSTSGT